MDAKNWLIVYHLPTNTKKCLETFQKMLLRRHFRLPKALHFYQFMRNAFLGKVRLK